MGIGPQTQGSACAPPWATNLTPRWGSMRTKRRPAASQMRNLQRHLEVTHKGAGRRGLFSAFSAAIFLRLTPCNLLLPGLGLAGYVWRNGNFVLVFSTHAPSPRPSPPRRGEGERFLVTLTQGGASRVTAVTPELPSDIPNGVLCGRSHSDS